MQVLELDHDVWTEVAVDDVPDLIPHLATEMKRHHQGFHEQIPVELFLFRNRSNEKLVPGDELLHTHEPMMSVLQSSHRR